ncbi:MAG: hypothetical protein HC799_14285, partial [Limnothrix sp. RL_2_0]|nr:hypothetical protein [Limnothrix sp. RL_2_0]
KKNQVFGAKGEDLKYENVLFHPTENSECFPITLISHTMTKSYLAIARFSFFQFIE